MGLEQGPEDIARQMAQLDREIVRLAQAIEQGRVAGEDTRKLALALDRAKRRRGFLEFYVPKADASAPPAAGPGARTAKSSCAVLGCLLVGAIGSLGALAGLWLLSSDAESAIDAEPAVATVMLEPDSPSQPAEPPAEPPSLPRFRTTLSRTGTVTAASGVALAAKGDPCWVTVAPHQTKFNCRIIVRCGGHILYGEENAGFNECTVVAGEPVAAYDRSASDGDPICQLDLRARSVRVRSDQPGASFDVRIELDDPNRDAGAGASPASTATATASSAPTALPSGRVVPLPRPTAAPPGTVPRPAATSTPPPRPDPVYGLD